MSASGACESHGYIACTQTHTHDGGGSSEQVFIYSSQVRVVMCLASAVRESDSKLWALVVSAIMDHLLGLVSGSEQEHVVADGLRNLLHVSSIGLGAHGVLEFGALKCFSSAREVKKRALLLVWTFLLGSGISL